MIRRDDILELQRARPFVPFRIHMSSGETYDVRHPEFVWASNSKLAVTIEEKMRRGDPHDSAWLSMVHVVKVTPINGKHRRKAGNGH
jgi:hypothetical protein